MGTWECRSAGLEAARTVQVGTVVIDPSELVKLVRELGPNGR
jgi:hypothetical protein